MTKNKKLSIGKINSIIFLLIFVVFSCINFTAKAAQDRWEAVTPSGFSGVVNAVASFGDYVYLGTTQGVYRSIDRGANWTQINTGITNLNVTAIAIGWVFDADTGVYVADSSTAVYAATAGGIFKSTIGGNNWSAINTGLTQTNIVDLKIDQYKTYGLPIVNGGVGDASSLYAVASTAGSVYRSDNGGVSWSLQNAGISGEQIKKITTEPTFDLSSGNIFAITNSNKVYSSSLFSVDGVTSENWTQIYSSATDTLNGVTVINTAPGSEFLATSGGILRSNDAGANWAVKNSGLNSLGINSIASDYLIPNILYAAGSDGVYKSTDELDNTWVQINLGIGNANVKKVEANPASSTLVYATTSSAIYRLDLSDPLFPPVTNDLTAPAAITTLSGNNVTTNSVGLDWFAPGDDGLNGTASSYDMRYSTSEIDEANWNQATPLSGEPVPQEAGTIQSMAVNGLSPDTQYYFAIKSSDEVPNVSALSGLLGVHTAALPDVVSPAAPSGLSAI